MFSTNNTMREIMEMPLIGSRIGNLFPSCWIPCVKKEHWDHTMEQIKQEDTMEWGQPFWSDALWNVRIYYWKLWIRNDFVLCHCGQKMKL